MFDLWNRGGLEQRMVRRERPRRRTPRRQPRLEWLEERLAPATFLVNTLADTPAVNLSTGQDAAGNISLRSAIQAADTISKVNTLIVPSGTYKINGEIEINGHLTIKGAGAVTTIVDANFTSRIFEIHGGIVRISGLTIERGEALGEAGGGILNLDGKLTLFADALISNQALGSPGGTPGSAGGD